ncbi:MAG: hypothetical protein IH618_14345 [Ignavibacteriaceae bacterium]|nr:hypothetical protein [Ignavibacteriaceae bacterium]
MKIISALIILLSFTGLVNAQWQALSSPTQNDLWSVCFSDTNNGWVVGENGTIIHTTDGGLTWQFQTSGISSPLYSVFFIDNNTGWVVGDFGVILHTSNGGMNWNSQSGVTNFQLWDVHFVNSNIGWAVGGRIIHTTNGGVNWTEQFIPFQVLFDITFIDGLNGWAVGGTNSSLFRYIIHTTNGGVNWQTQAQYVDKCPYKVSFMNELDGWISGQQGLILHTTNGGNTWLNQNSNYNFELESIFFVDNYNGWTAGSYGTVLRTTDAGITWNNETSNILTTLYDIFFTDPYHGWAVGVNGGMIRYSASGSSISISIKDGWNMLSVPLLATDMTGSTLFPTAISPFFLYNNVYNQVDTLVNGKAYWAKFNGDQNALVTGIFVNNNEISVNEGWNLVGPFHYNLGVNNISSTPPNIITSSFFEYNNVYQIADTLKIGKGYWVKVNQNGTLHLNELNYINSAR